MSGKRTLPARYFTDADLFRSELERFYFSRWIHVGRASRIPNAGDYFLVDVTGESVIVTRVTDGSIRAHFNVCRHRGTRMCSEPHGSFEGGRIRCPYHGWTYNLNGNLLGAPHMGQDFCLGDYPLRSVKTDEWDGNLFLNFDDQAASLPSQLENLPVKFANWQMRQLRIAKTVRYDVAANWKLIVLNYNECLHCPVLHPTLNRLTNYLGADNEPPSANYIGGTMGFREDVESMSLSGKRVAQYLPGLDAVQRQLVAYYVIFPNLLLSLHPDYVMTHPLLPKAVDRTEIVCEWLFSGAEMQETGFDPRDAVDFWDLTNREDWIIAEKSQQGIASRGYVPGPYSPREELLWAFDDIVREKD